MAGDGEIRRWSPGTGHTPARVIDAPDVRPIALAFDPKGLLLVQEADRLAWLSAVDNVIREVDLPAPVGFVRSSDTRQGIPPMPVTGRNEPRPGSNISPGADRIARSADGRTLAMVRGIEILLGRLRDDGSAAAVVPLKSPELIALVRSSGPPGRNRVFRDIALSPDGGRLFLATPEGISGWAIRGERLERLWIFPGKNPCMALSPDGRTLAIGDRAGALLLVEPGDGRIRRRLDTAGGDATTSIGSLVFSPDGSELAVGSREQATPSRSVDSAIRDGSELAAGSRGQVRLWAVVGDAPRPLVRLPGHRGLVTFLAYDPHGDLLATGGDDNAVKVWDLARVRRELALLGLDCKRH
jgi:WD40 repeat protein